MVAGEQARDWDRQRAALGHELGGELAHGCTLHARTHGASVLWPLAAAGTWSGLKIIRDPGSAGRSVGHTAVRDTALGCTSTQYE